jgi:hypothetical protein
MEPPTHRFANLAFLFCLLALAQGVRFRDSGKLRPDAEICSDCIVLAAQGKLKKSADPTAE